METEISINSTDATISKEMNSEASLCKICSKSFSNKLSRNRHQLYCRKKHFSGQPNIRKSCAACRRAKVKCNSGMPNCSRCQEKDFSCVYEKTAKSSTIAAKITLALADRTVDNVEETPEIITDPPGIELGALWTPGVSPDIPFELNASDDWNFDNILSSFSTPQDSGYDGSDTILSTSSPDQWGSALLLDSQLSTFEFTLLPDVVDFLHFDSVTSNSMFEGPYLSFRYNAQHHDSVSRMSTIARRQSPFMPTARPMTAAIGYNFILQNIKIYPYMLLNQLDLPPFIHISSIASESNNLVACPSSDHLAICKNITQMYQTRTPQTKAFVWRSIEAERQRFADEHETATQWDTLSMLQSLTTYILLRIFDDDVFTIDFDVSLIQTMTTIAIKLEQQGFLCAGEVHGYRPQWQEWIHMESKRRIVIILFFICLLFELAPDQRGKSLAGLSILPLPATKALWQAKTETEWETLYDDMLLKRQGRRYLSYADLVFLGKVENSGEDPRMRDLNGWFTTLDGLGVLVMMAATTF